MSAAAPDGAFPQHPMVGPRRLCSVIAVRPGAWRRCGPPYTHEVGQSGTAVEAVGLRKHYGHTHAVEEVSLSIPRGSLTTVLGPNGAGKTTTLEMLEGFRDPDAGTVRVLGVDPRAFTSEQRARVGVMLQTGGVWSMARPVETIAHLASFYRRPWDVDDLVGRLELGSTSRTPYRRLSGGEQQRTKLACAVVGRPDVAFLDEPTAGLDPHSRRAVWALIEQMRADGTTILLSTHLMDEAERLSDHIVIINKGRVEAEGSPEALMSSTDGDEITFAGPSGLDLSELSAALATEYSVSESGRGKYVVAGPLTPQAAATVTAWCAQRSISPTTLAFRRRSLEEVFLAMTAQTEGSETATGGSL